MKRAPVAIVLLLLAATLAVVPSGPRSQRDMLNSSDRIFIARALAEGQRSLQFIIASDPARTDAVAAALRTHGGLVRRTVPAIGYIRAELPVSTLGAILTIPGIELADVLPLNQFDYDLQSAPPLAIAPANLPTPSGKTPKINGFTGLSAMGVPQFRAANPTYDGRGTIVGFLEAEDPLAPGLRNARTLEGHTISKIAFFRADDGPFDPESPPTIPTWISMRTIVHAPNGSFNYNGHRYRTPYPGDFRVGSINVNSGSWLHYTEPSYQKRRAVVPKFVFPILWDTARGKVWVNTHQDGNFSRDHAIGDYANIADLGALPVRFGNWDELGTPGRPTDAAHFVVQTDAPDAMLRFDFIGFDTHGAMVAGSATGNGFFNGAFDGVAPGARTGIVEGYYPYLIEGFSDLAARKADVISASFVLTPYAGDDGVLNRIVNRIITTYNVPIVISASNDGPVTQSVEMPSTASEVISAGGWVSAQTARYDEGATFPNSKKGVIVNYSSRGPGNDGAMKPDILSQTEWLTSSTTESPPNPFRQNRFLPRGYEVGGGTSQAAPTAAGAVALLISAAKQAHLAYTADLVKRALVTGASEVPYQSFEQGGGLINLSRSWAALKQLVANPPPEITVQAPVATVKSDALRIPNSGSGMYLREGWFAGMRGVRTIAYTLSGESMPASREFAVRISGDTHVFSAPKRIRLEAGTAVNLPVTIRTSEAGIHSAVVQLVDPQTHIVVDQRLCTVVAAERFTAANGFTIAHRGAVEHPGYVRYFFAVPKGATSFSVDASAIPDGNASSFDPFSASRFVTIRRPDGSQPPIESRYVPLNEGLRWAHEFDHPNPGVWEMDVQNVYPSNFKAYPESSSPTPPTRFTFKAAVYRLAPVHLVRTGSSVRVAFRNEMAPLHVHSVQMQTAAIREITTSVAGADAPRVIPFTIPAGSTQVFGQLQRVAANARVHLYLFNCAKNIAAAHEKYLSQEKCRLADTADWNDDRLATTADPKSWPAAQFPEDTLPAGRWVAVLDAPNAEGPVAVRLRIGIVSLASNREGAASKYLRTGDSWSARFPVSAMPATKAALLDVHAVEALEIWQKNPPNLITTMKSSHPRPTYRYGSVWSAIL